MNIAHPVKGCGLLPVKGAYLPAGASRSSPSRGLQQKELTDMLANHCSHAHARINRPHNRRRSKLPAPLALLALALLAAPHAALAQVQTQGAVVAIPSAAPELKVMTWNIRGGLVKPGDEGPKRCRPNPASQHSPYLIGIAKEIRRHAGLDVVALQEVYRSQAIELKRMLFTHLGTNLDLHFVATVNCDRIGDQYGLAIFSRYKFLEGSGRTVRLCTHCPGNEPRVLARVKISVDGQPIHIYNTHFPPGGAVHLGMASLISFQVAFVDRPDRAVLLGDFYFSPFRSAYNVLTSVFTDAWVRHHGDKECENTNPTMHPRERDDYVFVRGSFRVDAARVTCRKDLLDVFGLTITSPNVALKVPDHLPLTVSLALVD